VCVCGGAVELPGAGAGSAWKGVGGWVRGEAGSVNASGGGRGPGGWAWVQVGRLQAVLACVLGAGGCELCMLTAPKRA
jgi:hypothetical protein